MADREQFAHLYHKASQSVSAILVPVSMMLILFCNATLYVWSGDLQIVRNTGPVLGILSVGTLLNGFVNMPLYAQLAHGWTSLFLGVNIALVIILVPLLVFLSSLYGTLGAAAVWVLLNSCYVLITVQIMHGRILQGEKREWYLHDVGLPTAAALVVALAGRMAMPENLSRVCSWPLTWLPWSFFASSPQFLPRP